MANEEEQLQFIGNPSAGRAVVKCGSRFADRCNEDYNNCMITTITQTNTVSIPPEVKEHFGIKPGYRLDWRWTDQKDEILIRVIPDRGALARQLLGAGRRFSPETDAVADLINERTAEE